MQQILLKTLLKSKLDARKDASALIDEFVRQNADLAGKQLEEKLANLLVFITQNGQLNEQILKDLINEKISAINIDFSLDRTEEIYEKLSASTPNLRGGFEFEAKDVQAISQMRKNFYWVKNEFNENLQNRLKDTMERVFSGEIARAKIAAALRAEFGKEIKQGVSYFSGLSDHIIAQSQNIARVNQATKAGAPFFRVEAIIDAHTTCICRCMHGRIIPAAHLQKQAAAIMSAKSMRAKKAAATWRDSAYLGRSDKLPSNFGLPPYHFKCRTELIPVWVDEFSQDGVKMKATQAPSKDEILRHIDKTGVERVWQKSNSHILEKHDEATLQNVVKALNSINTIAQNSQNQNYTNAFSDNGYFMVFDGDKLVTAYKPSQSKKEAFNYFKRASFYDKKEVIKWNFAHLI